MSGGTILGGTSCPATPLQEPTALSWQHMSNTAGFKLRVIETAEQSGNRSAGHEHNVSEKLVLDWRKKKVELKALLRE